MAAEVGEAVIVDKVQAKRADTVSDRVWREVLSWFWVILAFLVIEGGFVQARVIPSGSMEQTVLIGDHLIVSRFGYDMGVPFTDFHVPLWRNSQEVGTLNRVPRTAAWESGFHQAHDRLARRHDRNQARRGLREREGARRAIPQSAAESDGEPARAYRPAGTTIS